MVETQLGKHLELCYTTVYSFPMEPDNKSRMVRGRTLFHGFPNVLINSPKQKTM